MPPTTDYSRASPSRRRGRSGSAALLPTIALAEVLVGVLILNAASLTPSVDLSFSGSGTLTASTSITVQNGSGLRQAMDGNFSALIDALPISASEKSTLLTDLGVAESLAPGLFGDHDGDVDASDVALFVSLVQNDLKLVPSSLFSLGNVISTSLDGTAPTSTSIGALAFAGAIGLDYATAPIVTTLTIVEAFSSSSASHTLAFSINLTLGIFSQPVGLPSIGVNFTGPGGDSIHSISGLTNLTISKDIFGWGAPSARGIFSPSTTPTVSIAFGPATPVGDILIGGSVAGAIAIALLLLWRRRRRGKAASTTSPAAADEAVGTSESA